MKDKLKKFKRPPVDWALVIRLLDDDVITAHFQTFIRDHRRMSFNRCAWNVLKKYYSTTALSNYRHYGYSLLDVDRIR